MDKTARFIGRFMKFGEQKKRKLIALNIPEKKVQTYVSMFGDDKVMVKVNSLEFPSKKPFMYVCKLSKFGTKRRDQRALIVPSDMIEVIKKVIKKDRVKVVIESV